MRVVLLSHNARSGDALGHQIAARARYFREQGDDVHVWIECDRRLHPSLVGLTRLIRDPARWLDDLQSADLLIVHFTQDFPALDILPRLTPPKPRILFDYYGVTPPELWDGPAEMLRAGQDRRSLVWYADAATVHSRFMRDELCQATGYPPEQVHIVPLWFQISSAPGRIGPRWREHLRLPAETRLVLFVGRLAKNKRLPIVIEALALLRFDEPSVHLVVVGDHREIYHREYDRCRELARVRQVADRIHWLGHVPDETLAQAYREADVLVIPSRHEGCCLPVWEAMAAGLPVIVARSSALPETMAGAGLSFEPDDEHELAEQIRRVLRSSRREGESPTIHSVAVIAPRFGGQVVGGAEQSLRRLAESLNEMGRRVEVFSTGRREKSDLRLNVHRFREDPIDPVRWASISHRIELGELAWDEFVQATRFSDDLLAEWQRQADAFDACIVGPSTCGLTWGVARRRPDRTLLVPCFHDEPLARLPQIRAISQRVGGLLYHSEAERRFAEDQLGIHHPNSVVIGTYVGPPRGQAERGRKRVASPDPYIVYSGRTAREKNVRLLCEWFRRYRAERAPTIKLILTGDLASGRLEPGIVSLGRLDESVLADVTAGAACLVQLSTRESLSLVALEAWNHGVPVIAHRHCQVLREWIDETQSGWTIGDYEEFRQALDELVANPCSGIERGRRGQLAVRSRFGDPAAFAARLRRSLDRLTIPLADTMRQRGYEVIRRRGHDAWREALASLVQHILEQPPRQPPDSHALLEPVVPPSFGGATPWLTIRVTNTGSVPLWPNSARWVVQACEDPEVQAISALDRVLNPGESRTIRLTIPRRSPSCREWVIRLQAEGQNLASLPWEINPNMDHQHPRQPLPDRDWVSPLERATTLARLPEGYVDVSEGFLAGVKRWLKRKLLGQFQTGYVDVLARQQAAFNRTIVDILRQMSEQLALLAQQPPGGSESGSTITDYVGRRESIEQQIETIQEWLQESPVRGSGEGVPVETVRCGEGQGEQSARGPHLGALVLGPSKPRS